MNLRTLPVSAKIEGKRILVRVDWNVPLEQRMAPEESLKIARTLPMIHALADRGAIIVLLTHLGRPNGRDLSLSTMRLLPLLKTFGLQPRHHSASVSRSDERAALVASLLEARPGSIHLLENVRFEPGEERNNPKLVRAYAEIGELFINDAFASSHRAHASVVGLAKALPSYAGSSLMLEEKHLRRLLHNPKRPFMAVIGGLKLSTKIPVLQALLATCDRVMIGGAMATTFAAARGWETGASFVEKAAIPLAKRLLKEQHLVLPDQVVVADALRHGAKHRTTALSKIGAKEIVVDIAPSTLKDWYASWKTAKTIVWNGPIGVMEIPEFGAGSRLTARALAACAKGRAFVVAGGGDTVPILFTTKTEEDFDAVSTGGGALLEYLATGGKLPGMVVLEK